uniref:G_PROTEIN_RECEP_F1_2 domain-containing protein n=1 Tax=Heterorhabditis bacteriophora TaxID=37862 RepID=A0A1I7X703_HETBA
MVDLCENIRLREPLRVATFALILPLSLYLIATLSYMVVSIVLFRRRDSHVYRRHFSAVWRLGTHLGIFTVTCVLMALTYYATSPMKDFCHEYEENPRSRACGSMSPLVRYSLLTALSSIGWFTRMTADPIIDVMIDCVLRRAVLQQPKHRLSTFTLTTQNEV